MWDSGRTQNTPVNKKPLKRLTRNRIQLCNQSSKINRFGLWNSGGQDKNTKT